MYGGIVEILKDKTKTECNVDESHGDVKICVRCTRCGEEFYREHQHSHQLHSCPTHIVVNGTMLKWCNKCNEFKDAKEFGTNPWCRFCMEKFKDVSHHADSDLDHVVGEFILQNLQIPVRLEAKLIHPDAKLPYRKRVTDAGHDIFSIEDAIVPAHGMTNIRTGLILSAPTGYYLTVNGRSGMSLHGVMPFRGIIDAGYCGELKVALMNLSDKNYEVKKHDRIAQVIVHQQINFDVMQVEDFGPEYNTRGTSGFSSSGR